MHMRLATRIYILAYFTCACLYAFGAFSTLRGKSNLEITYLFLFCGGFFLYICFVLTYNGKDDENSENDADHYR